MKKTKVIRTKPLPAEEDWYRTYHLDIKEIPNELDSLEELAEELLGWNLQKVTNTHNVSQNRASNVWRTYKVKRKELQRSSYLWRSGYIPRESGLFIERNKHWIKLNFKFDSKSKSSSKSNNVGGTSN
jgi:hypothetical protein